VKASRRKVLGLPGSQCATASVYGKFRKIFEQFVFSINSAWIEQVGRAHGSTRNVRRSLAANPKMKRRPY